MRPVLNRGTVIAVALSLLAAALLFPTPSRAQGQPPLPLGDPFEVAADPAGEQWSGAVARSADGGFVVVWIHEPWVESSDRYVEARRFDAQAQPRGAGYRVSVAPIGGYSDGDLDVAFTPEGGFVVAWESRDPRPYYSNVYARAYDADAVPLGPPFLATEDPIDDQYLVGVAVEEGGLFTVAWSYYDYGYDPIGARVFESNGAPRTGDLQIDTSEGNYLYQASVAASGPGEFVVGYTSYDSSYYTPDEVRAQKFDIDGNITVAEFRVDEGSGAGGYYSQPVEVGSDAAGNFTVLWGAPYPTSDVRARRFSSDGQPLGSEFVVGDDSDARHLAVSPGGRSLVYWERDYYGGELQAQLWAPDGTPEGPPFDVVDPTVPGHYLAAALDASESPVFVWHQWQVNQGDDVLARRFQTFERVFVDGFESGDASGWSEIQP
jgi:predicted RNA-binding protein with TRAM domain